jgi:DNA-binding transcriptional LysR family regulator
MDYRYLKAFIITAKHSSFSMAAKELNIAQSAISRQIKLLEESVDDELIVRSSKKMILTNKGKELYATASNFDKHVDNIFDEEERHPLRIGTLHGLLENWLYPKIAKYYKKQSRELSISIDAPDKLKEDMSNGVYDIIFTNQNIQSDLISSLKLFNEHLVLISKQEINSQNIQNYRWIVYNNDDNIFKLTKTPSNHLTYVNSITAIIKLVKTGVGIAVIPDHLLEPKDKLYNYSFKELEHSNIYMTTLNHKKLPNYIKELVEVI